MKSAERVWKVWVNVGEVEHTSEGVRKSAERDGGAERLQKIVEGLRSVAEWSGNSGRVMEGCRTECPLTSTPPSEKQRPGAVSEKIGLNLIDPKSTVQILLAAPGCFR